MNMASLLAATQNTSMFDPVSPPAGSIRNVAILALAVTGFIFVIVEGVLPLLRHSFPSVAAIYMGWESRRRFTEVCPSRSPGRWGRC